MATEYPARILRRILDCPEASVIEEARTELLHQGKTNAAEDLRWALMFLERAEQETDPAEEAEYLVRFYRRLAEAAHQYSADLEAKFRAEAASYQ